MKVKSVEIEGFHNVNKKIYHFENLNYLKGPNGVGKSTVLQAIQLAILGYIPGTNKKKEAIFKHANGKLLAVTVILIDDDDKEIKISRVWSGTGSTVTNALVVEPVYDITKLISDVELPIFNFSELLNLTANKQKDWFLNFLPKQVWDIDWDKELTDALEKANIEDKGIAKQAVLAEMNTCGLTGIESVRHANEYIKMMLSADKSRLIQLQGSLNEHILYEDIDEYNEDDIDAELSQFRVYQSNVLEYNSAIDKNSKLDSQLKQYDCLKEHIDEDEEYSEIITKLNELDTKYTAVSEELNTVNIRIGNVKNEYDRLKNTSDTSGTCPIIGKYCEDLFDIQKSAKHGLENVKSEMENLENTRSDLIKQINDISSYQKSFRERAINKKNQYETRDVLRKTKVPVPELITDYSLDEITDRINYLYDIKTKIEANKKYDAFVDATKSEKFRLENDIDVLKVWSTLTGVNGLQNGNDAFDAFEPLKNKMDIYISKLFGKRTKSAFNMESKANSFSFGIERNKTYIQYDLLSSGEKCMFTLAFMLSIIDISNSDLKLVMVDDMFDHLDDSNVNNLFKVLSKVSNIQMIFAGVKDIKSGGNIIVLK